MVRKSGFKMKLSIVGITGRMGQEVSKLLKSDEVVGGISSGTTEEEFEKVIKNSSVAVDFSTPAISIKAAGYCAKHNIPLVCGTTGFSEEEFEQLKSFAEHTPILYASNFSIGIFLMSKLIRISEKVLDDFDVSIIDRHHNKKKDKPSGTTLFLASQLEKTPQIVSLRVGGVSGDHICSFTGEDEEVTISHRSFSRRVFASGAVRCAFWLVSQKNGFYFLEDYLSAKK
ncbi:MAG: 4-hydroxy-tetrahydrodipicolinate reductase [Alphaproteobacteria bacterium]|nr:4-hydroxy-tetrahydrodipicolinate reductase [Alphaproteobacteria bacterium]